MTKYHRALLEFEKYYVLFQLLGPRERESRVRALGSMDCQVTSGPHVCLAKLTITEKHSVARGVLVFSTGGIARRVGRNPGPAQPARLRGTWRRTIPIGTVWDATTFFEKRMASARKTQSVGFGQRLPTCFDELTLIKH